MTTRNDSRDFIELAAEHARLIDSFAVAMADLRMARATAMQANVCITRLVAALAEVAPSHPLLTELPFSQYREPNAERTDYR